MKVSLKIIASVLVAVMCLSLFGCTADEPEYRDFNYFAMDTYITLRLARKTSDGTALTDSYLEKTADECEKILAKMGNKMNEGMLMPYTKVLSLADKKK